MNSETSLVIFSMLSFLLCNGLIISAAGREDIDVDGNTYCIGDSIIASSYMFGRVSDTIWDYLPYKHTVITFSQEQEGTEGKNPELALSFAQIIIAFALFLATFFYAYYTRRLAEQQKKTYLLEKRIWEKESTPRIWFSLARCDTTKIYLVASNLGGDIAQSVRAHIKTEIVEFPWEWPCILPKERIHIDLPDEISHINNLDSMKYLRIEYGYLDLNSNVHEETQEIEPKLMKEGINAPHRISK